MLDKMWPHAPIPHPNASKYTFEDLEKIERDRRLAVESATTKVYIGGALANPEIVRITALLQDNGISAFSEWYTPGAEADVKWRDYEIALGYDYRTALKRPAAVNTFTFDKRHIDECDTFLMVLPCGKSAHMELGYAIGKGKRGIIYMPNEPERWDVMYGFADRIVMTDKELLEALHNGK